MASRRMFSLRVTNSARFLKMPISSQALYFHLGLHADDDGIVEAYPVLMKVGCSEDDLRVLTAKGFIVVLNEDLVTYISDWRENNKIRADRKVDSIYKDLLISLVPSVELLEKKERADRKEGRPVDVQGTDNGRTMDGIGKDRLGKDRIGKDSKKDTATPTRPQKHKYGEYEHVLLTDQERDKLINLYGEQTTDKSITFLDEYIEMKGYKAKSHFLCIKKWVVDAVKEKEAKKPTGDDVMREWLEEYGGDE